MAEGYDPDINTDIVDNLYLAKLLRNPEEIFVMKLHDKARESEVMRLVKWCNYEAELYRLNSKCLAESFQGLIDKLYPEEELDKLLDCLLPEIPEKLLDELFPRVYSLPFSVFALAFVENCRKPYPSAEKTVGRTIGKLANCIFLHLEKIVKILNPNDRFGLGFYNLKSDGYEARFFREDMISQELGTTIDLVNNTWYRWAYEFRRGFTYSVIVFRRSSPCDAENCSCPSGFLDLPICCESVYSLYPRRRLKTEFRNYFNNPIRFPEMLRWLRAHINNREVEFLRLLHNLYPLDPIWHRLGSQCLQEEVSEFMSVRRTPAYFKLWSEIPIQDNVASTDRCPICCKEFRQLRRLIKFYCNCGLCFHPECIITWLQRRSFCPVCQCKLPENQTQYDEQLKERQVYSEAVHDSEIHTDLLENSIYS